MLAPRSLPRHWLRWSIQSARWLRDNDRSLLALFTIILAIGTIWLAVETHWLVKDAEQTAERQQRAYVSIISGATYHGMLKEGPGILTEITFKNSGATPGYDFQTRARVDIRPNDGRLPFSEMTEERATRSIIGAGESDYANRPHALAPGDLEGIRSRKLAIYVWGSATYTDIFGTPRYFLFRCMMTGIEDVQNGWALKPHWIGYDAN